LIFGMSARKVDRDGLISQLIELTGCEADVARDVLEAANWDLSAALPILEKSPRTNPPPRPLPDRTKPKPKPKIPTKPKRPTKPPVAPPPETLQIPGTNAKFQEARANALERHHWLFVSIDSTAQGAASVVTATRLRDFFTLNFKLFQCSSADTDGRWFASTYSIPDFPCFTIIEPVTGEVVDQRARRMTVDMLFRWFEEFLAQHPEKGQSITQQMELCDIESSADEPAAEEEDTQDAGKPVSIMVAFPETSSTRLKRVRIEIGENEKVRNLYRKVEALLEKKAGEFKLVMTLDKTVEITDQTKRIAEIGCAGALVRVIYPDT
jgi:hypothetical protein